MMDHDTESGREVVLDNRKLIIAFVVLIAICFAFFFEGFILGRRQGVEQASMTRKVAASAESREESLKPDAAAAETPLPEESSGDQPLNWYKDVNRLRKIPADSAPLPDASSEKGKFKNPEPAKPSAAAKELPVPGALSGPVSYTVQVGAFVHEKEAEIKAKMLRDKGFECRIEAPVPPEEFHFVKVGKFDTRADAVAVQLRLKKSGFPCFVKAE